MFSVYSFFVCVCFFHVFDFRFLFFLHSSFFGAGDYFSILLPDDPSAGPLLRQTPFQFPRSFVELRESERASGVAVRLSGEGEVEGKKGKRASEGHIWALHICELWIAQRQQQFHEKTSEIGKKSVGRGKKKRELLAPTMTVPTRTAPTRTGPHVFFLLLFLRGSASDRADCSFARLGGREDRKW